MKFSSRWKLILRLWLAMALLFTLLYIIITTVGYYLGVGMPLIFEIFALFWIFVQYFIVPKMVEITMKVKYVSETEAPELHEMVGNLAIKAGIPKSR